MLAAQFGHTETVNVLIDAGADVNIRSYDFFPTEDVSLLLCGSYMCLISQPLIKGYMHRASYHHHQYYQKSYNVGNNRQCTASEQEIHTVSHTTNKTKRTNKQYFGNQMCHTTYCNREST